MSEPSETNGCLTGGNLLFIVGCPRSGTTWLQRLLATHPKIKTGQESRLFEYIGSQFQHWRQDLASAGVIGRGGTGLACYMQEDEFVGLQRKYVSSVLGLMLRGLVPGEIFLEKTPSNARYVKEIITLLPAAKIIHLIRDPRDVTASLLAAAKTWGRPWATSHVGEAVKLWREHVCAAQSAGAKMPSGQYLELYYEDLFADTAGCLRRIANFAQVTWPDAEIALAVTANTAGELREGKGTPIPIHGELGRQPNTVVQEPKDFVRKARPGSWRDDLTFRERWRLARIMRKNPSAYGRYGQQRPSG
ncbi:MAG TPA: sulfotransferase [Candidatus Acidoferrales bacterium]|nr:sulfotransferase [Candidatus Acidoferrales bacterium]